MHGGASAELRRRAAAVLGAVLLAGAGRAGAEALLAKDEALALAFPGATVTAKTVFLTPEQSRAVKERTGREPPSELFTYYTATKDGTTTGYGVIETHVVRTLPEAVLVVLSPAGAVERVLLLAFYEPPEYRPPDRWLEQFKSRQAGDGRDWRVGRDVHGLTGATLTAHALTDALRRVTVLFDLVIRPRAPG
ncbi:MAG TPA: FMN-binding protein [Candidatus Limnocylindria bacterium]|nr:FMN-binding protein [Candidatus Limnocylindria bacterium]